jgi:hypothetical protein
LIFIVLKDDHADVNTSLQRVLIFNAAFIPAAVKRVLCWLATGYALVFVTVNLGVYFLARR